VNEVRRLAIGTVQFGLAYGVSNTRGKVQLAEAEAILRTAANAGVTTVDTAAVYGDSEEVIAGLLARLPGFKVVTKTVSVASGVAAVIARAEDSSKRFGAAAAYALLIHSAGDLRTLEGEALWRALRGLQDRGLFAKVGISAYASDDPAELARRFRPDIMQVPVSVLDQGLVRSGALAELKSLGVEIHARSAFVQGAIFMAPERLPPALRYAESKLASFHGAIAAHGMTVMQAGIGFPLSVPEIDRVVVGVTSVAELSEVIATAAALPGNVPWTDFAVIDDVLLDPRTWQTT